MQSRAQAIERLIEFVAEFSDMEHLAILQSSTRTNDETKLLLDQLALSFPERRFPVLAYRLRLARFWGFRSGMGVIVLDRQSHEDSTLSPTAQPMCRKNLSNVTTFVLFQPF